MGRVGLFGGCAEFSESGSSLMLIKYVPWRGLGRLGVLLVGLVRGFLGGGAEGRVFEAK